MYRGSSPRAFSDLGGGGGGANVAVWQSLYFVLPPPKPYLLPNIWLEVSRWGFQILTLFRKKNPKMHTMFRTTPSILFLLRCLGQTTQTPKWRCLVPKSFIGNCNWENSRYSHCFCILEHKQISSNKSTQEWLPWNYVPCLGRRSQKPYPVQRHIPVKTMQ